MFSSFKGLINKATESAKASVDTLKIQRDTIDNISSKVISTRSVINEKSKELASATSKIGSELLAPSATFVIANKFYADNVELAAGIDLLNKYDVELLALRTTHKNMAIKADITDRKIVPVYQKCLAEHKLWNEFRKELNFIPEITENINRMAGDVDEICKRIDLLEATLTEQIEQVYSVQLENYKQHQSNLTELVRKKSDLSVQETEQQLKREALLREQNRLELERIKANERLTEQMIKAREKERADRIREQEILLEREREQAKMREALNLAFQKELNEYKVVPKGKRDRRRKKKPVKKLEEVKLSDDEEGLEDFLSETSSTISSSDISSEFEFHASEESEDDTKSDGPVVLPVITSPEIERKTETEGEEDEGTISTPVNERAEKKVTDIDDSWM
eukprot:TRINITY_DN1580_c0_g1_i1.p1 TRINITY_DN1580_c0_g1~~TRINITY_DN1580_c0_g1_i1.p1  ORF type:complete len:396 (+),score=145.16 TRINITY_DN1580_c0_g1_i1:36-1223(+)